MGEWASPRGVEICYGLSLLTVLCGSIMKQQSVCRRAAVSCLALFLAYGMRHLAFIVPVLAANLLLLHANLRFANEYVFMALNLSVLYFYKMFGRLVEPHIQTTYDISAFLMVLVIKASYLAKEYHEVRLADMLSGRRGRGRARRGAANRLRPRRTGISDALDYLLFLPGLLSGPTPTFREFRSQVKYKGRRFPAQSFLVALAFLLVYQCFSKYPFRRHVLSGEMPIWGRMVVLYLYNVVLRMKFHFIWKFADCCFILHGFDSLSNIDFMRVELTESVREISSHWNRFVSRWLKEFFFLPLKPRSIKMAVFLTYTASACLHGFHPCYLVFFLSLGLFSNVITRANSYIPLRTLRQVQMLFFLSFFSMPFYLLSIEDTYLIWRAVGFYGLFHCFGLMLVFMVCDLGGGMGVLRKFISKQ